MTPSTSAPSGASSSVQMKPPTQRGSPCPPPEPAKQNVPMRLLPLGHTMEPQLPSSWSAHSGGRTGGGVGVVHGGGGSGGGSSAGLVSDGETSEGPGLFWTSPDPVVPGSVPASTLSPLTAPLCRPEESVAPCAQPITSRTQRPPLAFCAVLIEYLVSELCGGASGLERRRCCKHRCIQALFGVRSLGMTFRQISTAQARVDDAVRCLIRIQVDGASGRCGAGEDLGQFGSRTFRVLVDPSDGYDGPGTFPMR